MAVPNGLKRDDGITIVKHIVDSVEFQRSPFENRAIENADVLDGKTYELEKK